MFALGRGSCFLGIVSEKSSGGWIRRRGSIQVVHLSSEKRKNEVTEQRLFCLYRGKLLVSDRGDSYPFHAEVQFSRGDGGEP